MGKFYVVRKGRQTGIFSTWPECQAQVNGFSGAEYKSFLTQKEAEVWLDNGTLVFDEEKLAKAVTLPFLTKKYIGYNNPIPQPISCLESLLGKLKISNSIVYTDGSCQDGKGGWAYVVLNDNGEIIKERSGKMPDNPTTNNRAELMAILQVLQDYKGDLTIRPDSDYSIKCVSVWWKGWKKRGWKKADGKTPENLDLIQEIIRLQEGREITYDHVYGHSGNIYNERCDQLAKAAALI